MFFVLSPTAAVTLYIDHHTFSLIIGFPSWVFVLTLSDKCFSPQLELEFPRGDLLKGLIVSVCLSIYSFTTVHVRDTEMYLHVYVFYSLLDNFSIIFTVYKCFVVSIDGSISLSNCLFRNMSI